jgi:hypothetical protein
VVRIFLALAIFAVGLLITNLALGLMTGDYNGVAGRYLSVQAELNSLKSSTTATEAELRAQQENRDQLGEQLLQLNKFNNLHVLCGIAASLVTLLVNSVTITYFIGTTRWCSEVVDTFELDTSLAKRSQALKRRTFPWALASILAVIAIIVFGGAALPFGANAAHAADWVTPHLYMAWTGTFLVGWSFLIQSGSIGANYRLIQEVMREVERVRGQQSHSQPEGKGASEL